MTAPDIRHGPKGRHRRSQIVAAAAELLAERGPQAVSHRAVAQRAGVSLSATTYYFDNLNDLLNQAGMLLMTRWAEQAETVAAQAAAGRPEPTEDPQHRAARLLVAAVLPPGGVPGHYQQLVAAHHRAALTAAYREGRRRLDAALTTLLSEVGSDLDPNLVLAVIDGAVVSALSEGRALPQHAETLLRRLLALS